MVRGSIFPRDRVAIVGVLNVTPDSFSDGGQLLRSDEQPDLDRILPRAEALVAAGADLLDVGGESTRPGSADVPAEVEIARTQPVVAALATRFDVPISIDTRKSAVADAALASGASWVNDVSGLRHDRALASVVARHGAGLVVGHLRGEPADMQRAPHFDDPLREVAAELSAALAQARAAGVSDDRLAADPGIGFGKRLQDNLVLVAHAGWLRARLGVPLWIGVSRKSFLGTLTGDPLAERDLASHVAGALAVFAGADVLRVHDVAGASRAVAVALALRGARRKELS